jgi:hypothetical protein
MRYQWTLHESGLFYYSKRCQTQNWEEVEWLCPIDSGRSYFIYGIEGYDVLGVSACDLAAYEGSLKALLEPLTLIASEGFAEPKFLGDLFIGWDLLPFPRDLPSLDIIHLRRSVLERHKPIEKKLKNPFKDY